MQDWTPIAPGLVRTPHPEGGWIYRTTADSGVLVALAYAPPVPAVARCEPRGFAGGPLAPERVSGAAAGGA